MIIQSPERSAPPSRFADWLEIKALLEEAVSLAELASLLRIEEDTERHRFDSDTGEIVEEEILQMSDETSMTSCAEELQRRLELLGAAYPFELVEETSGSSKHLLLVYRPIIAMEAAQYTYLLCLILSTIRLDILALDDVDKNERISGKKLFSEYRFGYLLQICSSIALGGYLLGDVVSFGYPRPNKTRFLAAHADAWKRFGSYDPVSKIPQGLSPSTKDGGIDLIGWVHFADRLAAKILVFGQVASGFDWIGKPVGPYVKRLKHWFSTAAFTHWTEVLAIPFNITDAGNFIEREGSDDLRSRCLIVEESTFGIVFDRDRLTGSVARYLHWGTTLSLNVDRSNASNEIKDWVQLVAVQARAAA
jgi:hypothetical protein